MWHTHDGMGWWMLFSGGLWIILLTLIVFAVFAFIRAAGDRADSSERRRTDSAIEIARQRYARGEIDREQFEQIRRDLSEDEPRSSTSSTP